jgi:hypothetical protein
VAALWRDLQDELRDNGPSLKAKDIEQRIRMIMDVAIGHDLPVKRIHQAAYPTRSKRPELIDLWDLSVPDGELLTEVESQKGGDRRSKSAKAGVGRTAAALKREPLSDAELVAMHVEVQRALSLGVTAYAMDCWIDLKRALCRELDIDPFDDGLLDHIVNELHNRAWPDASTRPPRLEIAPPSSPFE